MPKANDRQEGGDHYRAPIQHWDYVLANGIPYLEAQVIKYLTRWRKKGGHQDLRKAKHFLDKLLEVEGVDAPPRQGEKEEDRLNSRVYDMVRERATSASPKPNYP